MPLYFFIISVFIADAQNIGGGLALGLNASQVDGDNYAGYHKMGLNIGVTGFIPVRDKMAISVEISLNQKGSTKRPHPQDPYGNSYKLRLDYLDIPVLFNFKDKNKLIVAGGFSYGTIVRFDEIVNGTYNTYPINDPPYSPFDINAIADLKYPIRENFSLILDMHIPCLGFEHIWTTWDVLEANAIITWHLDCYTY